MTLAVTIHDDAVLSLGTTRPLAAPAQRRRLRGVGVYSTLASSGDRRAEVSVWGLDLSTQEVDTIQINAGQLPRSGEVLADAGNGDAGFPLRPRGRDHSSRPQRERLGDGGEWDRPQPRHQPDRGWFRRHRGALRQSRRVRSLTGSEGVNVHAFRLADNYPDAQTTTIAAVHDYLLTQTGTEPFVDLPTLAAPASGRDGPPSQVISLLHHHRARRRVPRCS